MVLKKSTSTQNIYQIKIKLKHIKPPIWRRVLIKSNTKLGQLHNIVQEAMGWDDYHLHSWTIKIYTEQKEFLGIYTVQLDKWKHSNPSAGQKQEIDRLEKQLVKFRELNIKILDLAEKLKGQTFETFLAKSDEEIGLEALLGRLKY